MKRSFPGPVPVDAAAYIKHKGMKVSFDWRDTWRQEHAAAFTVAKAMQLDVLQAIRGEVEKAIAEGRTLRSFQEELTPTLQQLGWWGKKEMVDPLTGEIVTAQLGSPRRLKTIYRANLRTARSAGQYQRAQRTKSSRPYLLYQLGPSKEHRVEHVSWHGTLLTIDDSWWQTHMPPNGWGCKCQVRQVSRAEARKLEQRGVLAADRKQLTDPETGLPTGHLEKRYQPVKTAAPKIKRVPWENKRTGEIEMVPEGIDPGWDTNPGFERHSALEKLLVGKLDQVDPASAAAAMRDLTASGRYSAFVDTVLARGQARGEQQIIGIIAPHIRRFVEGKGQALQSRVLIIDDKGLLHAAREAKAARGAALSRKELERLPELIAAAERVLWDTQDPALLYVFASEDKKGKVVVRINQRRKGKTINRVVTTGKVEAADLNDPRYEEVPEDK